MISRIKKNDTVVVVSGKDKGKQGTVIAISSKKGKVMVQGVAIATHFVKPRRQGETAGIRKNEAYIDISKVMPVCQSCKKACRVNVVQVEQGNSRSCNRCKEIF